jgi:hypothetical protein
MRIIILILGCIFLSACATHSSFNQNPEQWRGKNVSDLKAKIGTPAYEQVGPNGNAVYVYVTRNPQTYYGSNERQIATLAGPRGSAIGVNAPIGNLEAQPSLLECFTVYEVNAKGVIVDVRKRGSNC